MSKKVRYIPFVLFLSLSLFACNLPAAAPVATEPPVVEAAAIVITATPASTPVPVEPVQACNPIVTTTIDANVRGGPGTVYVVKGQIPLGGTAPVAGKNSDGTWWYIQFAGGDGGYAWIAGSVTSATCIPATLPVIAAPPPPVVAPPNTPVPGAPDPTDVPSPVPPPSGGPYTIDPGLIDIGPFYLLPSPTPVVIDIPTFDLPCMWLICP
jgi:uncharacterized protein YraI